MSSPWPDVGAKRGLFLAIDRRPAALASSALSPHEDHPAVVTRLFCVPRYGAKNDQLDPENCQQGVAYTREATATVERQGGLPSNWRLHDFERICDSTPTWKSDGRDLIVAGGRLDDPRP